VEAAPAPSPAPARATSSGTRGSGTSRRALKNWRVRSRLLLLITIPTLTAVVLGGTRIVTSVQSALTFQRIETLSNVSSAVTTLAGKLEDERDQTVIYIADGPAGRGARHAHPQNPRPTVRPAARPRWPSTRARPLRSWSS
jgi:hypothetical protein